MSVAQEKPSSQSGSQGGRQRPQENKPSQQTPETKKAPSQTGANLDDDDDPGKPVSQAGSQQQVPGTAASKQPPSTGASRPASRWSWAARKKPQGNEIAGLSPEKQKHYLDKSGTPFTEEELKALLKQYISYDKSKGKDGIPYDKFLNIPDFNGHPFIAIITKIYMNDPQNVIMPEQFLDICSILTSKQDIEKKRKLAFKVLDIHKLGYLQYDEIFRMYKLLFDTAIPDDAIVDLVFRLLEREGLETPGMITYEDFSKLVPDSEINARFTIDIQIRR